MELIKREDRYDLYADDGSKIASTSPNPMEKLSLKNCEVIKNGYDLDELSENHAEEVYSREDYETHHFENRKRNFEEGFQKALEILGDKKFSEKDVKLAINLAWDDDNLSTTDIFQSLQQTEWDVEIEMVKEEYIWSPPGEGFEDQTYKGCREVPKLDADGCLILKLKL